MDSSNQRMNAARARCILSTCLLFTRESWARPLEHNLRTYRAPISSLWNMANRFQRIWTAQLAPAFGATVGSLLIAVAYTLALSPRPASAAAITAAQSSQQILDRAADDFRASRLSASAEDFGGQQRRQPA